MKRWTASRKAELIKRVRRTPQLTAAILAKDEISAEEFAAWEGYYDARGVRGLRTTRVQENKRPRRGLR